MFSSRHLGETGREAFNFLSPASGELPVPNFFLIANLANRVPSKTSFFRHLDAQFIKISPIWRNFATILCTASGWTDVILLLLLKGWTTLCHI
jgi:hypothetical protein